MENKNINSDKETNLYGILIVHMARCFDAERMKENNIVFVDHWAKDENIWYIISHPSEEARQYTLSMLEDRKAAKIKNL